VAISSPEQSIPERPVTVYVTAAEIAKLDLRPGDRLVLHCARELEPEELHRLGKQCQEMFPGHVVVVIPHDMRLGVVREGESPVKFREFF
jgi:hypothetical protein